MIRNYDTMAIEDKNGCLHSEENGRFVSKQSIASDDVIQISPQLILDYSAVTKKEWAMWYKAIGEIRRGMTYPITKSGYLIQINCKIFVTSGTYEEPKLNGFYEFDSALLATNFLETWVKK